MDDLSHDAGTGVVVGSLVGAPQEGRDPQVERRMVEAELAGRRTVADALACRLDELRARDSIAIVDLSERAAAPWSTLNGPALLVI